VKTVLRAIDVVDESVKDIFEGLISMVGIRDSVLIFQEGKFGFG
jgi:hypothetical protein